MKEQSDLKGVGGWLTFLIVCLCLLVPLSTLGQLPQVFERAEALTPELSDSAAWLQYKTYFKYVLWTYAVLLFSAGYRLWMIFNPASVRIAITVLWVSVMLKILGNHAAIYFSFGGDELTLQVNDLAVGVNGVFWAAVWTTYLLVSRRVKNTYYRSRQSAA